MKPKRADQLATSDVSSAAIFAILPVLHAYAMRRLRSRPNADDAVQQTVERAWRARESFIPGASLKNWMFQILRNELIDRYRLGRHFVEDVNGVEAGLLVTQPDQLWRLQYADVVAAIEMLSSDQRRAILLVVLGLRTSRPQPRWIVRSEPSRVTSASVGANSRRAAFRSPSK